MKRFKPIHEIYSVRPYENNVSNSLFSYEKNPDTLWPRIEAPLCIGAGAYARV